MSIRMNYTVLAEAAGLVVARLAPLCGHAAEASPRYGHVRMTIVIMKEIAAGEFKAKCLGVLDEVQRQRQEVLITKRGKPVAKLVPIDGQPASFIGSMKGTMEVLGDIVAPIDVPWEADE
jgi:prevent-host-death family protein